MCRRGKDGIRLGTVGLVDILRGEVGLDQYRRTEGNGAECMPSLNVGRNKKNERRISQLE